MTFYELEEILTILDKSKRKTPDDITFVLLTYYSEEDPHFYHFEDLNKVFEDEFIFNAFFNHGCYELIPHLLERCSIIETLNTGDKFFEIDDLKQIKPEDLDFLKVDKDFEGERLIYDGTGFCFLTKEATNKFLKIVQSKAHKLLQEWIENFRKN